MLLPPTEISTITLAGFTPSELNAHRISGGKGVILESPAGQIAIVREEDGSVRIVRDSLIRKDYSVDEGDATDVNTLMEMLGLPVATELDPPKALVMAAELLQAYRWVATDELTHDVVNRETFLIPALLDPTNFLSTITKTSMDEKEPEGPEVEEQVTETTDAAEGLVDIGTNI
jgi:hypothetical protein